MNVHCGDSVPRVRVLIVSHATDDFLRHRLPIARALRDRGLEVHVAVPLEDGAAISASHGFEFHRYHLRRKSVRLVGNLRTLVTLVRLYRRLRPDVVHHIGLKPALHGGLAARITRVPATLTLLPGLGYVFSANSLRAHVLRWVVERCLPAALRHRNGRIVFQNPDDLEVMVTRGSVTRDRAVIIRGSGIDPAMFPVQPEASGIPVVLMAARLLWEKGVGEFVQASRVLRSAGVPARFLLAGEPDDGHPSAVSRTVLERWHAAGDIEWLGWRDDIPALLALSHVACLPSYYGEGIPRFLVEAAASGRAIVTTDHTGCREIVRHLETGLLVEPRDARSLSAAIVRLIRDPELRSCLGTRARTLVVSQASLERVVASTLELYGALLARSVRESAEPTEPPLAVRGATPTGGEAPRRGVLV